MTRVNFILGIAICAALASCAGRPRECQTVLRTPEWERLASTPSIVSENFYEEMFFGDGLVPKPRDVAWYRGHGDRYLACVAGAENGCGDHYAVFSRVGDRLIKDDVEEIVVCAASTTN